VPTFGPGKQKTKKKNRPRQERNGEKTRQNGEGTLDRSPEKVAIKCLAGREGECRSQARTRHGS